MAHENQKKGQDSKKGRPPSAGKRKAKIQGYFASAWQAERKIRRILRHSGAIDAVNSACSWADKNGATSIFRRLMTPEFERAHAIRAATRAAKSAARARAAKKRRWARRCQRNPKLAG